jgi:hypothetical protein
MPLRPKSAPTSTQSFAITLSRTELRCELCFRSSSIYSNSPGEHQAALQTIDTLRSLQEKPAAKLISFLYPQAMLQAAIETHTNRGPAYEEAFTKHYSEAIDSLPWDVVQDDAKEDYAGSRLYTKPVAVAYLTTDLDPAV